MLKNGRSKKSNAEDKGSKRRGEISSLKDKILSNRLLRLRKEINKGESIINNSWKGFNYGRK